MQNLTKNKPVLIGGIVVLVLVIIFGFSFLHSNKQGAQQGSQNVLPQGEAVPTVDSSVVVSVVPTTGNKEITMSIKNQPSGTTSIDYELSYDAQGNVPKGVIGTINITGNENVERKITLGTCSTGVCTYDQGVTKIHVSLKFNGGYGARSFDRDFPLN